MAQDPLFQSTGRREWRNWHDFKHSIDDLINVWNGEPNQSTVEGYTATTRGFQRQIGEALGQDRHLRAIGAGWSYSTVGTVQGQLFNTRPLNYRFSCCFYVSLSENQSGAYYVCNYQ